MIEDTFLKLKSNLELSDTFQQTISRQQKAVRSVVDNNHASVKNIKLIGSVGRQTRIQPRAGDPFDIDMLVIFGAFDHWVPSGGITKDKALEDLHTAVTTAERYAKKNPDIDSPTVTFTYENDVTLELVPAWLDNIGRSSKGDEHAPKGRAYWVPSRTGWQLADYDHEADYITKTNEQCGGMLVPTIKMVKAAKREHFPELKSYHLEVITAHLVPLRLASYKTNSIRPTYPALVADVLYMLPDQLDLKWGIPSSLSPTFEIDPLAKFQVLAKAEWLRKQVTTAYRDGTDADKHRAWKDIFKDQLPLP